MGFGDDDWSALEELGRCQSDSWSVLMRSLCKCCLNPPPLVWRTSLRVNKLNFPELDFFNSCKLVPRLGTWFLDVCVVQGLFMGRIMFSSFHFTVHHQRYCNAVPVQQSWLYSRFPATCCTVLCKERLKPCQGQPAGAGIRIEAK